MATGPEHYTAAEELLAVASDYRQDGAPRTAERCIAEAQVHATLALAAATALQPIESHAADPDWQAWLNAASEARKQPDAGPEPCPRCRCVRNCECDMTIPDLHEDDMRAERDHDIPADDDPDED